MSPPEVESWADTPLADYEFDRQLAAESRMRGRESGPRSSLPAQHYEPGLRPSNAADFARHPLARQSSHQDANTIFYGRAQGSRPQEPWAESSSPEPHREDSGFGPERLPESRTGTPAEGAAWADERLTDPRGARSESLVEDFEMGRNEKSQPPPAQPSAPRQSEPAPRKKGLFSWFRGRGESTRGTK
jgi:hypothetical protein